MKNEYKINWKLINDPILQGITENFTDFDEGWDQAYFRILYFEYLLKISLSGWFVKFRHNNIATILQGGLFNVCWTNISPSFDCNVKLVSTNSYKKTWIKWRDDLSSFSNYRCKIDETKTVKSKNSIGILQYKIDFQNVWNPFFLLKVIILFSSNRKREDWRKKFEHIQSYIYFQNIGVVQRLLIMDHRSQFYFPLYDLANPSNFL